MSTEAKKRGWCSQLPACTLFFFKVVVTFGLLSSDAGREAAILLKGSREQPLSAISGTFNTSSIYCAYSKTSPPVGDETQDWPIANISRRCLHAVPFRLRGFDKSSTVLSFSTTFTFALAPAGPRDSSGSTPGEESIDGLAFILVPAMSPPPDHSDAGYLGLLNATTHNQNSSHTFGVEFDSYPNSEFEDPPFDHVGIDLNSLISVASSRAGYIDTGLSQGDGDGGDHFKTMVFNDGSTIQAWITYNASTRKISVTISPVPGFKPDNPLLETKLDLSGIIEEEMYAGFSTSTGADGGYSHVSTWSFEVNGTEYSIISDYSEKLPSSTAAAEFSHSHRRLLETPLELSLVLGILIPITLLALFSVCVLAGCCLRRVRKNVEKQFHDLIDMENLDYIPKRYSYKELSTATEGFSSERMIGSGGFGSVYKGILPAASGSCGKRGKTSAGFMLTVAVKRMGSEPWEGTKAEDIVAELEIIGRLRHRNLVQLLGWCSEKDELLLVYEYMSNGSLDEWLFSNDKSGKSNHGYSVSWDQRKHILCGVASALGYLHAEWKEVVVHRDVKMSNVILDSEFNAKLGDFGLAAGSQEHYSKQFQFQSISVAGTWGYLAPEARSPGMFSDKSDVYSFGVLALEVATGRPSVDMKRPTEEIVLLTWVLDLFERGRILDAIDDRLCTAGDSNSIDEESRLEMAAVLHIGLICSHPDPNMRPSMGQVVQMLKREAPLLPIACAPSHSHSRAPSFPFSFSDHYVWADHSVELGMIENSDEINLIPQSQTSNPLSKERSSFSFVL
ncbi:unnamed protein product [Calypogeia fissa]